MGTLATASAWNWAALGAIERLYLQCITQYPQNAAARLGVGQTKEPMHPSWCGIPLSYRTLMLANGSGQKRKVTSWHRERCCGVCWIFYCSSDSLEGEGTDIYFAEEKRRTVRICSMNSIIRHRPRIKMLEVHFWQFRERRRHERSYHEHHSEK